MRPFRALWLLPLLLTTSVCRAADDGTDLLDWHQEELARAVAPMGYPAFDSFKSAIAVMTDDDVPAVAIPATPDPALNPYAADPALPLRDVVIAANRESLRLLRQGLGQRYYQPDLSPSNVPFPWYARYRSLFRLLQVEADWHAGHGRWSAAVESVCDLAAFGGKIEHGAGTSGQMVGALGYRLAMANLHQLMPYLDREALTVALRRWPQALAEQPLMSDVAAAELDVDNGFIEDAFTDPDWRTGLDWLVDEGYPQDRVAAITPERAAAAMAAYRPRLLAVVDQPFGSVPIPDPPDDILAAYLATTIPAHWAVHQLDLASQQAMLAILAIEAYRRDHDALPPELGRLVSGYLPTEPQDPFTGKPLIYRVTGDTYQAYSVGPNRQDDGGQPFVWPQERSDAAGYLTAVGDVW